MIEVPNMDGPKTIAMNAWQGTPRNLMPLPDHDSDPTEAAIPWQACTSRGWMQSSLPSVSYRRLSSGYAQRI